MGLRYELSPPAIDANDAMANFDMDTDPANPHIVPAGAEGDDWASRALQGVNYQQFAPRAGAAYSLPGDKTVIRGGFGIFYSNLITAGRHAIDGDQPAQPPAHQPDHVSGGAVDLSRQGFPDNALTPAFARNVTLVSYDRSSRHRRPTSGTSTCSASCRAASSWTSATTPTTSSTTGGSSTATRRRPAGDIDARRQFTSTVVPGTSDTITLSNVVRVQKDGWSRYRALQTKVEKRYSKGLSLLASYAWSRTIGLANNVQNPLDIEAEVAVLDTYRAHNFVASGVYELPGGFSVSPIVTLVSGAPLNLTVNGNPANTGQSDRPNVVGDWELDNPSPEQWFNTAAFVANDRYTYGNAPRNLLRGPRTFNVDMVVRKTFSLSARVNVDLRFESFNLTNSPAFGNPNTQVGNPNFGRISSAGAARSNQLAVKLLF